VPRIVNGRAKSPISAPAVAAWALTFAVMMTFGGGDQPRAQSGSIGTYFEICKRLGNIPGTLPMRRCIEEQRAIDNDPLSALSQPSPSEPELRGMPILEEGLPGQLPGASSAEELLKSSPERLLLGPDYRSDGQGIYE
jgi:hypothetical protein